MARPPVVTRYAQSAFTHASGTDQPIYKESFIANIERPNTIVHSAAIEQFADGTIHSVWFQGTREGGNDVALYSASLDRSSEQWSEPVELLDREQASKEIGRRLKTIGNPVFFTAENGRTWLFFVTVSLFGWSGGDINYKFTDDGGQSWSPATRLRVSPIPHSGTLVKGAAVQYDDGSIGLPVYRSYDQYSFAELVNISADGSVMGTSTISNGTRGALQPSIAAVNDHEAVAMMRYNGDDPKRVERSTSSDAGRTWTTPLKTDLPNPDSALAIMGLSDDSLIMVFNNSTEYRNVLSLARSLDAGLTWKILNTFEEQESAGEAVSEERSYPFLTRTSDGQIHLVYTWKRRRIKHIIFNEAWVRKIGE